MKTVEQEMRVRYWCCLVLYEIPQQNLTNEAYSAHNQQHWLIPNSATIAWHLMKLL